MRLSFTWTDTTAMLTLHTKLTRNKKTIKLYRYSPLPEKRTSWIKNAEQVGFDSLICPFAVERLWHSRSNRQEKVLSVSWCLCGKRGLCHRTQSRRRKHTRIYIACFVFLSNLPRMTVLRCLLMRAGGVFVCYFQHWPHHQSAPFLTLYIL